jgi:eukaryotic-like serine/threonine-protein kinase
MALTSGTKLGPYEIQLLLGAGGMGEVYRARDTRLERTVAIKILPSHLSDSPEARQRFGREARAISSLNHPNICTLYDVGSQDGTDFLVMEFLEGETLAARLREGPLRPEQLLKYAIEICEGLDRAHRNGIVHRDLKPGNIMLTKAGAKLMDFGLVKPSAVNTGTMSAATIDATRLTSNRTIIGTIGYMSPEQVQGKGLDARSDIFSLGSVLYEMATGRRAFEGSNDISVLSAILEKQPRPITELQPLIPAALDRAVCVCLEKDPDDRWQSAHDLQVVLRGFASAPSPNLAAKTTRLRMVLAGAVLVAAIIAGLSMFLLRPRNAMQPAAQLQISGPSLFFIELHQSVSPNGRYLAFTAFGSETEAAPQPPVVWLRPLNSSKITPLKETEGAGHLFWSPDSRYIAYFAKGLLKKVSVEGGTPQTICEVPGLASGTWSRDDTILYTARQAGPVGLFRVAASGGTPTSLQLKDEHGAQFEDIAWPYFLGDGDHFLFYSAAGGVYVGSVRTGASKHLTSAESRAEYSAGHIFYVRDGNLVAQRFDDRALEVKGEPIPLASGVRRSASGSPQFSVSPAVLSYLAGAYRMRLVLRGRNGAVLKEIARGEFGAIAISRDGHRLAAELWDPANSKPDLWIYDLDRDTGFRFASHPGGDYAPIWSPDGKQLIYSSQADGKGPPHLYRQSLNGSPSELLLPSNGRTQRATDWSPDGTQVLFTEIRPGCFICAGLGDTWILSLRDGTKRPLLQMSEPNGAAQFSPDGRWIAFVGMDGNDLGVYAMPVGSGERQRVSVGGGITPRWRRDGKELFYQSMDSFDYWSVPVVQGAALHFGKPISLFVRDPLDFASFDVLPDGSRLVSRVALPGTQGAPPTTVVLNWQTEVQLSSVSMSP